jgi:hypothetical protein
VVWCHFKKEPTRPRAIGSLGLLRRSGKGM